MPDPCGHCSGLDPCDGLRHRRYCQLTDPSHPDYDPRYILILQGRSAESIAAEEAKANPSPPVNYLAWVELVDNCPDRGPVAQCGCHETHVCLRGKGRNGEVTRNDCHACVTGKAT